MSVHSLLLTGGGLVALFVSIAVAVTIGPADISTGDVWASVAAHLGLGEGTLAPLRDGIVWNLRMPRTLLAAVCGAGLAVCGAVMQSLLRNPLADPFVLGVSSGASTGAVAVVVLGVGGGAVSLSAGAFLGALLSFGLVLLLSHTLGRIPHRRGWTPPTAADAAAVTEALACTGLTDRAGQSWHTLSGGERQRTQIARALAQEPRELLLDEPTNHLDLLELVASLPVTTVIALHDLNLAAMYCDRLLVLRDGRAVTEGTPAEVLTPALIEQVYGVRAEVTHEPGHPVIRFLRPAAREGSLRKRSTTSDAPTAI
ncbi:iron chelate uptake ABC transporter family permease subunit [Streptomyces sp. NPDC091217]|uniref:iron chelate uptake ABC transporter family permease subunit n=1 Tax=Streptomyces sp. NPDC091217 TaxID=3365975 RepID=UPI0037F6CF1B